LFCIHTAILHFNRKGTYDPLAPAAARRPRG